MFDVFTIEIETLIKDGISNLFWFHQDLRKCWLRAGVPEQVADGIGELKDDQGRRISKRRQMDELYRQLRESPFNLRVEISRNFVRCLVEHKDFARQSDQHRIEVAERAALKLRDLVRDEEKELDARRQIQQRRHEVISTTAGQSLRDLSEQFRRVCSMSPQQRGLAFEPLFGRLLRLSSIHVEDPFRIVGEQIDGAIKHDGHFYLIELKWTESPMDPKEIASLYYKVEGKLDARGIAVSMNGFSSGVIESLPRGKDLKLLLFDGRHVANLFDGVYSFSELMERATAEASLKGNCLCPHDIRRD